MIHGLFLLCKKLSGIDFGALMCNNRKELYFDRRSENAYYRNT